MFFIVIARRTHGVTYSTREAVDITVDMDSAIYQTSQQYMIMQLNRSMCLVCPLFRTQHNVAYMYRAVWESSQMLVYIDSILTTAVLQKREAPSLVF